MSEVVTNYIIVVGTPKTLPEKVRNKLAIGWQPYGAPFRTGNKILLSGNPAYPGSCDYTNEIAQAICLWEQR